MAGILYADRDNCFLATPTKFGRLSLVAVWIRFFGWSQARSVLSMVLIQISTIQKPIIATYHFNKDDLTGKLKTNELFKQQVCQFEMDKLSLVSSFDSSKRFDLVGKSCTICFRKMCKLCYLEQVTLHSNVPSFGLARLILKNYPRISFDALLWLRKSMRLVIFSLCRAALNLAV